MRQADSESSDSGARGRASASPYMNVAETAEYLRRKPEGIYKLMKARAFVEGVHYYRPRVGTRKTHALFIRAAVDRWLMEGTPAPVKRSSGRRGGVNQNLLPPELRS